MDSEVSEYHIESYLLDNLITPEFLHTLEIWSRYKGPDFHAFNTLVRDKGQIKMHGGKLCDVTEIYDTNCSSIGNPRMVIMAEVSRDEGDSKLDYELFPARVFVYNIDEAYIDEDDEESSHYPDISKYTECPTFERLKADLEGQNIFPNYLSMVYPEDPSGLTYKFYKPNKHTDKLSLMFNLRRSLETMNREHIHLLGNIKENKRVTRDDWMRKTEELTKKVESEKRK